ncbi:hypothetical protein ACFHW2_13095 [Actinomadura sp. LOL_016]|uniref:hypothetical protein n=1 Tax=unclassified Actinomadura TaxID=2626254 RepID=UPI003A811033
MITLDDIRGHATALPEVRTRLRNKARKRTVAAHDRRTVRSSGAVDATVSR